jgi:hypothetical protein
VAFTLEHNLGIVDILSIFLGLSFGLGLKISCDYQVDIISLFLDDENCLKNICFNICCNWLDYKTNS